MASRFMVPFGGRSLTGRSDPVLSLHREMNRLFDDALRTIPEGEGGQRGLAVPQIDVHESEQEFCLTADVPGVAESDIDLRVEGDTLVIRGEKKQQQELNERGYHFVERSSGAFQRAVRLPFEPDPSKVTADYENGVLTIHVPKQAQQERGRRIEVRRGAGSSQQRTIEGQTSAANDPQHTESKQAASHNATGQAGGSDDTYSAPGRSKGSGAKSGR